MFERINISSLAVLKCMHNDDSYMDALHRGRMSTSILQGVEGRGLRISRMTRGVVVLRENGWGEATEIIPRGLRGLFLEKILILERDGDRGLGYHVMFVESDDCIASNMMI